MTFLIINLVLSCVIVAFAIWAHFYTCRTCGRKSAFWTLIAAAWAVFGVTYGLRIMGTGFETETWYMIYSRSVGYLIVVFSLVSLVLETKQNK